MKPLVLLAISMALLQTPSDNGKNYIMSNGDPCPPEGTAHSAKVKQLNVAKNRETPPNGNQIDADISLAVMLAPGDDEDRFDSQRGAVIAGYVIAVRPGGKESCNCEAKSPVDRDTHIELALSPRAPPTQRVIVEVSPRLRHKMKAKGDDWSTEALTKKYRGKWVKVTGWMLFDFMHVEEAENTNPGGPDNWRATCWEIHPITSIAELPSRPPQTPEIDPAVLAAFHGARVRQLKRSEASRKAVQQTIQRHRDGLEPEELKEIEEERNEIRKERKERDRK